jgi:hypothetical protein
MSVLAARLAYDAASTIESRNSLSVDRLTQADAKVHALRQHLLDVLFAHAGHTAPDRRSTPP